MAAEIDVENEVDGHVYKAVFTTQDFGSLAPIVEAENQSSTSWEGFVAAVLKKGKDVLQEAIFYKDGAMHDGPNGEPGYQMFDKGFSVHAVHYKDGERTLAQDFNAKGKVLQSMNFKDDYLNDEADGKPAIEIFNDRGQRTYLEHHTHGKLNDGLKGEPARQWFENGKLVKALSYKAGERIEETETDADLQTAPAVKKTSPQPR